MSGLWTAEDAARFVRRPTASDDKYTRGVVGMRTGSIEYPGAAVLGIEAAWRAGAGMVRYVGPERAAQLVLQRRPETVLHPGRVQAWVIGSGTDAAVRTTDEAAALRGILTGDVPVVVDAGALDLAAEATAPAIVTPHDGEHARLRASLGLAARSDREAAARETAAELGATVLLKGADTIVATPHGWTARVRSDVPWLATAGTGDVLAGAVGALVAAAWGADDRRDAEDLGILAASAAWLHGRAAAIAAASLGPAGGPITALDVAGALPRAVAELLTP